MSNQIDDLIASIQHKFDNEFMTEHTPSFCDLSEDPVQFHQPHNPQSAEKIPSSKQNPQAMNNQDNEHQNAEPQQIIEIQQSENIDEDNRIQDIKEEDEQDENKYRDLSKKLETALKKISSSKKQFVSPKLSSTDYLKRFQDYERKKEKDLELKRKLEEEKKSYGLKSKPDINKKSQQIAEETSYKPIYQRFDQILNEKKKKMESNLETKKAHEEEEYQNFMEEYRKHAKLQADSCRDTETYFNDMIAWKSKIQKQREQKKKQIEIKEKQGYTFKPQLNKKSQKLIKSQKRIPIQDREIEKPRVEQIEYSFQPNLRKRKLA